jgi:type III pantothenate kinase
MLYEKPCIVVDLGTGTNFEVVNKNGEFIGGVIAPGLNLQMNVLNKFTSKLPKIDVATSTKAIGHNTTEAILSGVIRGTACMIDGLVEQCEAELCEKATLIATGGYSGLISSYLKRPFDFINPTLTLEGLRFLYDLNK